MAASEIFAKLLVSIVFCAPALALLVGVRPAARESWWYPNPERWDYSIKLSLFAFLEANTPDDVTARWFVRAIALFIVGGTLTIIWSQRWV